MKVTDVIAESLHERGVDHVFGLTGGAVVHLFDSVCNRPDMKAIFTHHEQAASFACAAYGRVRDGVGVGMFTTGPGGTNALTGLAGAWVDSIASVFISGQARREHLSRSTGTRQVGTQELDILAMAEPVTKRAAMLQEPEDILYELDLAFHTATTGRPGPVWLDIPLNLQWANVDKEKLHRFTPSKEAAKAPDLSTVSRMIREAKRPLLVMGSGLQNDMARSAARKSVAALGIPYVVTFRSFGAWPHSDPMNLGVLGIAGNRGGNLAVYNADLIVAVGNHLPMPQTGGQFQSWAPNAKRVVVNIDEKQLAFETVRIDEKIHMDAGAFFEAMNEEFKGARIEWDKRWLELVPLWRAAS
ncbi:MAG: thiamine pyrophosphate-binding protein, partial [Alphaproteobacteria bacterium]